MASPENRIAMLRKKRGMTQQALAEELGVHWVTMSKLERGKAKLSLEVAERLARLLGVPLFQLFSPQSDLKLLRIEGTIEDGGRVERHSDRTRDFDFSSEYLSIDFGEWWSVGTEDLFPIFRLGDLVRIQPIEDFQKEFCLKRLVIGEYEERSSGLLFGILGFSTMLGHFELQKLNGARITGGVGQFLVKGCVTSAFFSPVEIGEPKLGLSEHSRRAK